MLSRLLFALPFISLVSGHFFLESPPSIGFNDEELTEAPCGGFDPTDRSGGVTDWPVGGYPFSVVTTHLDVVWTFKAALLSDVSNFVDIYPNVHQTGVSQFCLPSIPGIQAWIGQPAVFQAIQRAPDGLLHQCAAIRFVAGGPAGPDGSCGNSTSVRATLVPGTGPQPVPTQRPSSTTMTRPSTTAAPTVSDDQPEPTEDISSAPTSSEDEPTSAVTGETLSTEAPIYEPTTLDTSSGGSISTSLPTYDGSTTLTPNVSTAAPTAPAYTGAASGGMVISFGSILLAVVALAL